MATGDTFEVSRRTFCAHAGSYTEQYGIKGPDGKWSNQRTVHLIVPYTEITTNQVALAAASSPIADSSAILATYDVPPSSLGDSTYGGASFTFEQSATTRALSRADESGFYTLATTTRTAGTPFLQAAGITALEGFSPTIDDILVSDRTYTQAIGTCEIGYGNYDEKNNSWSQRRTATIIGKFRERTWERRALPAPTQENPHVVEPHLYFDTFTFLWGLVGRQQRVLFEYEYQKNESTLTRATPNGFYTLTNLFKQTTGIEVV